MKARSLLFALAAAVGCATSPPPVPPPPPPPPPPAEVTLRTFVDGLAGEGEWIVVAPYGQVWRPLHVAIGWQPYLRGQWAWTADGWFWVTDEPWGWATYHYGRWVLDPALGWFWVPGYVWGPAWVAWREGDGFVGWAPLLPGDAPWWTDGYPLQPTQWIFVPMDSFVAVPVVGVAVPRDRVPRLVRSCRPAPPPVALRPAPAPPPPGARPPSAPPPTTARPPPAPAPTAARPAPAPAPTAARPAPAVSPAPPPLGGPPPQLVESHVGRPVTPSRLVPVAAPAETRRSVGPGAVPVYRPAPAPPKPAAAPAPRAAPPPPARPADPERR